MLELRIIMHEKYIKLLIPDPDVLQVDLIEGLS